MVTNQTEHQNRAIPGGQQRAILALQTNSTSAGAGKNQSMPIQTVHGAGVLSPMQAGAMAYKKRVIKMDRDLNSGRPMTAQHQDE